MQIELFKRVKWGLGESGPNLLFFNYRADISKEAYFNYSILNHTQRFLIYKLGF